MQEIKSKKNNKMKIAIIVLSIALIVAIGGIFGVYAATQQNINTSFSIRYSIGDNVAVALGAKTVMGGTSDEPVWFTSSNQSTVKNENNLYVVPAPAPDNYLGLAGGDFGLSSISTWRWVCFYIENLSNEFAVNVTFTDGAITNEDTYNMTTMYLAYEVKNTEEMPSTIQPVLEDGSIDTTFNPGISLDENNQYTATIQPGSIYAIQIGIGMPYNVNESGAYVSDENGGIGFTIEQA